MGVKTQTLWRSTSKTKLELDCCCSEQKIVFIQRLFGSSTFRGVSPRWNMVIIHPVRTLTPNEKDAPKWNKLLTWGYRAMNRQIKIGGLMRCCIAYLLEDDHTPNEEGTEIDCKYCKGPLIYKDDFWIWNKEKAFQREFMNWHLLTQKIFVIGGTERDFELAGRKQLTKSSVENFVNTIV